MNVKLLLTALLLSFSSHLFAQNNTELIEVNYSTSCMSSFIVSVLEGQVSNPNEKAELLRSMEAYDCQSTLTFNPSNGDYSYVLDTIANPNNVSAAGYTEYTFKVGEEVIGKEYFIGKEINYKNKVNSLNWEITSEKRMIGGYECIKAVTNNNIIAWYTPKLPISCGPSFYNGLPGLIMEVDTGFERIFVTKIKKVSEGATVTPADYISDQQKYISINEILAKKDNFRKAIENQ
ncbi:GLPGLI family protein [Sediminitomix flava]|uniref:GLPGLI family protein n=1 Tax=Sediminitomix flava TaxID=379075 RepID=A0A315Z606_SEDFL|nr:GLPGLI family protein [Sediminitomix flava]PWJ38016.1 GLPGLI family protein [Sediminitomix flava]